MLVEGAFPFGLDLSLETKLKDFFHVAPEASDLLGYKAIGSVNICLNQALLLDIKLLL